MSDDGNGDNNTDALATLKAVVPEDMPFARDAKDINEFVQRVQDAAAWMGNSVRVPGPDASDADRAAFRAKMLEKDSGIMPKPDASNPESYAEVFKALGRPAEPDGYGDFGDLANAPSGEDLGKLRAWALKHNLTEAQFKGFMSDYLADNNERMLQTAEQREQAVATLRGEWGPAFDDRLAAARKAAELNGATASDLAGLTDEKLDAATLKAWNNVAQSIGAEGVNGGNDDKAGGSRPLDVNEIGARIDELNAAMHDRENPPTAAQMRRMNAKRVELIRQRHEARS